MTWHVNINGTWKAVSAISIKKAGAWKLATGIGIKKAGAWKQAFGTITPSTGDLDGTIAPNPVTGSRAGNGSCTTNAAVMGVVAGTGTAPYTYAWTKVSGADFTINSPSAASTTFTKTLVEGDNLSGVYRCTVTDNVGTIITRDVSVQMEATDAPDLTVTISSTGIQFSGSAFYAIFSASVSGGNGSYSKTWTCNNVGGTFYPNPYGDGRSQWNPGGQAETVTVTCEVSDTNGAQGSDTYEIVWGGSG